jgi:hypothetical protein
VTLREEHSLRVFENKVLRRIFGLKRDEVAGGVEWTDLAQDVDQWSALANTLMNLRVP